MLSIIKKQSQHQHVWAAEFSLPFAKEEKNIFTAGRSCLLQKAPTYLYIKCMHHVTDGAIFPTQPCLSPLSGPISGSVGQSQGQLFPWISQRGQQKQQLSWQFVDTYSPALPHQNSCHREGQSSDGKSIQQGTEFFIFPPFLIDNWSLNREVWLVNRVLGNASTTWQSCFHWSHRKRPSDSKESPVRPAQCALPFLPRPQGFLFHQVDLGDHQLLGTRKDLLAQVDLAGPINRGDIFR